MRTFDVPLQEVYMTAYLQEKMPADPEDYRLPAIVVYPGGGYQHLSPREAEPIAMEFAAAGYQVFVLYYSLAPKRYPAPLLDGARALAAIREHAEEWCVDPARIAVCGFSAGGHAAALLGCLWKDPVIAAAGISNEKARLMRSFWDTPSSLQRRESATRVLSSLFWERQWRRSAGRCLWRRVSMRRIRPPFYGIRQRIRPYPW